MAKYDGPQRKKKVTDKNGKKVTRTVGSNLSHSVTSNADARAAFNPRPVKTAHDTVADIVAFTQTTMPLTPGEWWEGRAPLVWVDEDTADRVHVAPSEWTRAHDAVAWAAHPAVLPTPAWSPGQLDPKPAVTLAAWALDPDALAAVVAADVDPAYARAAHAGGTTDAHALIEAWEAGIPLEYLRATA